jgi:hypothetical protein
MPASFASSSFTPDRLVVSGPITSRGMTLLSGENRSRAALLGKQTASTVPTTGTAGSNTGNGTCTAVAAGGAKIQAGTYTVKIIKAATNLGDFVVIAPDGTVVGYGTVGTAFVSAHLNLTLNDGATDFIVGDTFTIAVTGSGKYKLSTATATDGSAIPDCILAEDTDATSADKATVAYFGGKFNETEITLGSGHTIASVKEGLRAKGILLETPIENT